MSSAAEQFSAFSALNNVTVPDLPYAMQAGEITIDASHYDAGTAHAAINASSPARLRSS